MGDTSKYEVHSLADEWTVNVQVSTIRSGYDRKVSSSYGADDWIANMQVSTIMWVRQNK
jgi:hypothetical protein